MDSDTKDVLENIRTRVPRYLFRAWNNTPSSSGLCRLSGGHQGLNTPEAVTPLAFSDGDGVHGSVYDMDKESFTQMATAHLTGQSEPKTRLSSWAGSLSFALNHVATAMLGASQEGDSLDNVYVAIIDTKELWKDVQIFYVPHLEEFVAPDIPMPYPHEYLAHGVIKGPAYKAMPLRVFNETVTLGSSRISNINMDENRECHEIVEASMEKARKIGDQYGDKFALPMTLAVLCRKKRDFKLFQDGIDQQQYHVIMAGISGLKIPQEWLYDQRPDREHEIASGYGEVEQMCRLAYALASGLVKESVPKKKTDKEEQENETPQSSQEQSQAAGEDDVEPGPQNQEDANEENDADDGDEANEANEDNPDESDETDTEKKYANAAQARAAARASARRHEERMSAGEDEAASDTGKVRKAKEKAKRLLLPAR